MVQARNPKKIPIRISLIPNHIVFQLRRHNRSPPECISCTGLMSKRPAVFFCSHPFSLLIPPISLHLSSCFHPQMGVDRLVNCGNVYSSSSQMVYGRGGAINLGSLTENNFGPQNMNYKIKMFSGSLCQCQALSIIPIFPPDGSPGRLL